MLCLVLAVLCSSAVNVLMRLSEGRAKNTFVMFMSNYAVCAAIAFAFTGGGSPFAAHPGLRFALLLGLVSGCCYLSSLTLLRVNIAKNGVMLASVFMKLGVVVPALMAILFFGESPTAWQIAGFAIAVAAIIIIYTEPKTGGPRNKAAAGGAVLLLVMLFVSGLTESMANIYEKLGDPAVKDRFLFFNFLTACLASGAAALISRKKIAPADVLFGAAIGVPNYFCTRFLLLSLSQVPAVVVYPVYNIGAIVVISLFGLLLFRERPGRRKLIGLLMIIAALVLLNL